MLKPYTWNWLLSGSCAVTHSTMSSARRHLGAELRAASGWLRRRMILTTSSSIMLAEVSSSTRMRLPLMRSALMYVRSPRPRNALMRSPAGPLSSAPPCQALDAFFQRLDVGHQLVDVLALRDACRSSNVEDCSRRCFSSARHADGARLRRRRVLVGLLERIAQDHEILRADQHFFLELAHFAGELVDAQDFLRAGLRLHDGVEQHHRAEAAADAVEERQREDFEGAALFHHAPVHVGEPRARTPPRRSA